MGISRPSSSSRRICDMSVRCWASLVPLLLLVAQFAVASELEIRHNTSALESTPMRIRNNCAETIWPALLTQAGKALMGDFGLKSGSFKETIISEDGQRRVWGRINCSFNSNGTGSTNGPPWARETGDCNGTLGCIGTGNTPVALFEITPLTGGAEEKQSFYNISMVDGYDLPTDLAYISSKSNPLDTPPDLTSRACVATAGYIRSGRGNATIPMPHNLKTTTSDLSRWCPWDLQLNPPPKPGFSIYPYTDDSIPRATFSPRLSACARTNPDHDCCKGTSTNIPGTLGRELGELAHTGWVSRELRGGAQNVTLLQQGAARNGGGNGPNRERMGSLGALVVMLAWMCLF